MPDILRLPLTGSSIERAAHSVQYLIDAIGTVDDADLPAVIESAWRAARGRSRWIVAGRSRGELVASLAEFALDGDAVAAGQFRSGAKRPTFVFSGMGPQWWGMGRTLARELPGFARRIAEVDELLAPHYGRSVWDHLADHADPGAPDGPADQPGGSRSASGSGALSASGSGAGSRSAGRPLPTELAQPGNFLLQAALHHQLLAEGVEPEAVIGHSAGEVAAAYAAGVYDLAEAARVAVVRGRLQATLAGRGAMLAVGLSEDEALALIDGVSGVSLAAVNDDQAVTIAGDADAIATLEEQLRAEQIFAKLLRVEVPYHSPVMDEIADDLEQEMAFLAPKPARIPLYSTVSGARSDGSEWGASYWPANVRRPVLFARAVTAAMVDGSRCFVELAPNPVLTPSIRALAPSTGATATAAAGLGDGEVTSTPLLSRRGDEYETFVGALGALALEGVGRPRTGRSVPLPPPARQPQPVWDQDPLYDSDRRASLVVPDLTLLGRRVTDHRDEFDVELSLGDQPWLEGHQAEGLGPVVPATLWAELSALAAAAAAGVEPGVEAVTDTGADQRDDRPAGPGDAGITLTDLAIVQGLPVFANPAVVRMRVAGGVVTASSRPLGDTSTWTLHAVASVGAAPVAPERAVAMDAPAGADIDVDTLYNLFRLKGLHYTGPFRALTLVVVTGQDEAWAVIDGGPRFTAGRHAPWVLDAGLQLLIAAAGDLGEDMYLPSRLGRVDLYRPMVDGGPYRALARVTRRTATELVGSIRFVDNQGAVVADLVDVACLRNRSDDASRAQFLERRTYALLSLTPLEAAERFARGDGDGDVGDGVDDGGAFGLTVVAPSPVQSQDGSPSDAHPVPTDESEITLDLAVNPAPFSPGSVDLDPVITLDPTATFDPSMIEAGAGTHVRWTVPTGAGERADDDGADDDGADDTGTDDDGADDDRAAVATFDLVNRLGALKDPSLLLTLVGTLDQEWLFGLRRAAVNALGFAVRVVLARPDTPAAEVDRWVAGPDALAEDEIIIDEVARVNRLEAVSARELATCPPERIDGTRSSLVYELPSITQMEVRVEPVPAPGPGQITVRVLAVPLTWKDVGKVTGAIGSAILGTFGGHHLGLGALAEVVAVGPVAVGPGAAPSGDPRSDQAFAVGDLVIGAIRQPFRSLITLDPVTDFVRTIAPDPDPVVRLSLIMAWVTTYAALDDIGRIAPGDTVFIQSGAGALGSVLCRHAVEVGARVVTSVGTADKAAEVTKRLGDQVEVVVARGDDVPGALLAADLGPFDLIAAVVNGPARSLLFGQLKGRGHYLDLGKPSGPDEVQLTLAVDGNRTLTRIDTDQIAADDPDWFNDLITRALAKAAEPAPGHSVTRYPVAELRTAIVDLARGDTVGSLVVDLASPSGHTASEPIDAGRSTGDQPVRRGRPMLDPNGVYLITGGYGGVGLACAQWMVSRGARTVVLTGRSGRAGAAGQASIDLINAFGGQIWVLATDVADADATARLIRELADDAPIRGIVHAAGVIADGPFAEIDEDRVRRSFGAKLHGAHHLVDALDALDALGAASPQTDGSVWDDLDFFLFTSSMSALIGLSIQGTYAAANSGLDGLARALHRRGVQACSLQLGPIAEGGMVAEDERNARFFAASGLSLVTKRQLFAILDQAATSNSPVVCAGEIDWQRLGRSEPGNASTTVFAHLVEAASGAGDRAELDQLLQLDHDTRTEVLTVTLLALFAEALGMDDDALTADTGFVDMGVDSLAVVEIQVAITDILQHDVPMARLFPPDGNIGQLAARLSAYLDEAVVAGVEGASGADEQPAGAA